jgi:hypothetical protein
MPRHNGLYMQQWAACDRCGFIYPVGQLMMQKGLLVDAKCYDNLDIEYRPKVIAEVLADTEETTNELTEVYSDPASSLEF